LTKKLRADSIQEKFATAQFSKKLKIKIYTTITLPVVLYGCETWYLTLREERRFRVVENRVLREICEPKREVLLKVKAGGTEGQKVDKVF
jgi:hypothetical protein